MKENRADDDGQEESHAKQFIQGQRIHSFHLCGFNLSLAHEIPMNLLR